MAKSKGVFNPIGDLDELLPPPIPKPEAAPAPQPAASAPAPAPTDTSTPEPLAPEPRPAAAPAPRPRRRRAAGSTLTAEVAPEVYKALQKLCSREKARDAVSARTYVQVVLDAIEAGQDQLEKFWIQPAANTSDGGGLFSRRPATPMRRRRHSEPTGRIPLTGLNPSDAATLDRLIEQWQAPSRSALVEQALRFYAPLWPATRRRRRDTEAVTEDDTLDEAAESA